MTERMKRVWLGVSASKWALPAMIFALGLGIVAAWAVDGDNDGIDDSFETFFGLNTGTNDTALDPDADGLDNLSESLLWTDPFWADTDRDGFSDVNDSNPVSRAFIPWGDPFFTGTNNEVLYTWPDWMVGAFKSGGDWDSNLPAWHVTAAESNPASLAIEVDRALLTNDLRLKVGLAGGLESTLYLDLYDTNGLVIVTNALDNLLTGGGTGSVRIFSIPLESNSAAVGLWLRHGTGEVTVSGSLLYVDQDGDGLDADQERQLGTSDTALDSDQDGFSDAEEVFTYGTDPAQAFSVPYGAIQGLVSYAGVQVGTVHVLASSAATDWTSLWTATSAQPANYSLSVPQRRTYFLRAYRDVNGNGQRDTWEPCGTVIPSSLYVIAALTDGVDIVMTDPDTDGDGMSDVAELRFGFDPLVSNRYSRLPFVEGFETNTVTVGDIVGQNGWRVSETNAALVQTNSVYAGMQALELRSLSNSAVTVSQFFANPATNQVWLDVRIRVEPAPAPTNRTDVASCFFFDGDNRLVVLDGLQPGTNRWVTLTNGPSLDKESWARVSVRLDFASQTWLVCLNGIKLAEGLGFGTPISELHSVEQSGGRANTDDLVVSAHEPSGLSIDGDTLPDDWERQYIGTTDQGESDDCDGDGVSNGEEYRAGTDPSQSDSDHDGYTDFQEMVIYGTPPGDAQLYPLASICGVVTYAGLQTGAVMVVACAAEGDWAGLHGAILAGPDPYTIANVPLLRTYWVKAYRDTNGNGQKDVWEPYGVAMPAPLVPTSTVVGVNVDLSDPALDPALDTDGDGMSDAAEIAFGLSPFVSNVYARLPFVERFETNTVVLGDIGGQNGWHVSATNAALVQTNVVHSGAQALELKGGESGVTVSQFFAKPATNRVWVDLRMIVRPAAAPTGGVETAAAVFFDHMNRLVALDGSRPATNRWVALTNAPALAEGAWARISMRLDFAAQTWLVCLNGVKVVDGLGFGAPISELHVVEQVGAQGHADDLVVSAEQPAGLSLDGDTLPDDWEQRGFGTLYQTDDGDPDGDGVSNLEEYLHGTNPLAADTDSDGLPDGWELTHELNPTNAADAAQDVDGDGLSNAAEYALGTNPVSEDTDYDGLNDGAEINAYSTNPLVRDTDGDGMPDGWEVAHQLNPLWDDAWYDPDNDGAVNMDEYRYSTDPHQNVPGMFPGMAPFMLTAGWAALTNAIRLSWQWVDDPVSQGYWRPPIVPGGPAFVAPAPWINFQVWRRVWLSSPTSMVCVGYVPGEFTNSMNTVRYTDTTALPGVRYIYMVRAVNPFGPGRWGAETHGYAVGTPPPVDRVEATDGACSNQVVVSWSGIPPGYYTHHVWRATTNDSAFAVELPGLGSDSSYTDTTSVSGTRYWYWVRRTFSSWVSPFGPSDDGYGGVPPAPTEVRAGDGAYADKVRIEWAPASGPQTYTVLRGTFGQFSEAAMLVAGVTNAYFEDITAIPGTLYWYWVQAGNVWGDGATSPPDNGYCGQPPAPAGLAASDGQYTGKVSVTWGAVSNAASYEVWRGVTADFAAAGLAATVTRPAWDDSTAEQGTLYTYWVRARHSVHGAGAVGASDTGRLAVPIPAGFQAAENASTGAVSIAWQAVPGVVVYEVWRGPNEGLVGATRLAVTATASYDDAAVEPGGVYAYWVRASNVVGWVSEFQGPDWGCLALAAPASVAASDGSGTVQVNVTWPPTPGATRYEVWRSGANAFADAALLGTVAGLAYTNSGVQPGQAFWYWVRALGTPPSGGNGPPPPCPTSAVSAPDRGGTGPLAPGGVQASDGFYADRVEVTWTEAAGATGYEVWRATTNQAAQAVAIGTATVPPYYDAAVVEDTLYWYWVRAVNAEGWPSVLAGGDRGGLVLAAPTGGTASQGSDSDAVVVAWQALWGAVSYEVLRAQTGDVAQAVTVGAAVSASPYRDVDTLAGVRYWYWVRGINQGGRPGALGACGTGYRPLPAPVVQASDNYHDGILVTWSPVPGAAGYVASREGASHSTAETNWWDAPLPPGVGRVYTVYAVNGDLTNNLVGVATGGTHQAHCYLTASDGAYTDKVAVAVDRCCDYSEATGLTRKKVGTSTSVSLTTGALTSFEDTGVASGVKYTYSTACGGIPISDDGYARYEVDMDVDSDNNNGLDEPARSETEENQENDANLPGKLLAIHDDDSDGDGIPGFADGYNRDGVSSSDDTEPCCFVPIVVELPKKTDFARAAVTFIYDASNPAGVIAHADGSYSLPAEGALRLWRGTAEGASPAARSVSSSAYVGCGQYLPANQAFPAYQVGFDVAHPSITFYVEAVRPGTRTITVRIDPDGVNSPAGIAASAEVKVTVLKVDIVPDFNHDRVIDDSDKTAMSTNGPFRFWINDDADDGYEGNHIPGAPGLPIEDWNKSHVSGQSDLIDFFPLWLDLNQVLTQLSPSDGFEYKLKQANNAVKAVYTDLTKIQAGNYQTYAGVIYGPSFNQLCYEADTFEVTSSGVTLSTEFLDKIKNDANKGILMIEGAGMTTAPLVLEVWKGGQKIIQKEMLLTIDGVEKMYRHLNLRGVTGGAGGRATETNNPSNYPDISCANKDVVVLHGVNVDGEAARAWHAEMFKRLFWTGSKARFHGISYNSNAGWTSANYQENVNNAFLTSSNLSAYVAGLPGAKVVIAHSMGNIVVCNAIQDYSMPVDKYFMLDAAVATEALKESAFNEATNNNVMLSPDWKLYQPRTWASKWHELFSPPVYPNDARSQLTWKSRFSQVASLGDKVCNLYTSQDQCLDIYDGVPGFWDGADLDFAWLSVTATLDHYVWHKQEVFKGTDFIVFGIGSTHYAGWGFRNVLGIRTYSAEEANSASDSVLLTACVFRPDPSGMFSSTITRQLQNEILAKGIPALSPPVGHDAIVLSSLNNVNMAEPTYRPNGWPRNHPQYFQKWLHSDIKDMAYLYVYKAYETIVTLGGL